MFTGKMRPGREAEHSSPSSSKVKNGGALPPLSHVFMDSVAQSVQRLLTGLDVRGIADPVPAGPTMFRPDRMWSPPSLPPNGYRRFFHRRREAYHSPPTSAENKNGAAIPTPCSCFASSTSRVHINVLLIFLVTPSGVDAFASLQFLSLINSPAFLRSTLQLLVTVKVILARRFLSP
jgi:hypothetical protein